MFTKVDYATREFYTVHWGTFRSTVFRCHPITRDIQSKPEVVKLIPFKSRNRDIYFNAFNLKGELLELNYDLVIDIDCSDVESLKQSPEEARDFWNTKIYRVIEASRSKLELRIKKFKSEIKLVESSRLPKLSEGEYYCPTLDAAGSLQKYNIYLHFSKKVPYIVKCTAEGFDRRFTPGKGIIPIDYTEIRVVGHRYTAAIRKRDLFMCENTVKQVVVSRLLKLIDGIEIFKEKLEKRLRKYLIN